MRQQVMICFNSGSDSYKIVPSTTKNIKRDLKFREFDCRGANVSSRSNQNLHARTELFLEKGKLSLDKREIGGTSQSVGVGDAPVELVKEGSRC